MIDEEKVEKLGLHYAHHADKRGHIFASCGKHTKKWTTAALWVGCDDCKQTDFWKNREGSWLSRPSRNVVDLDAIVDAPIESIVPEKLLEEGRRATEDGRVRPKLNLNSRTESKKTFLKKKAYREYLGPVINRQGKPQGRDD